MLLAQVLGHVTQKSWQKQLKRSMRLAIFSPRVLPMSMVREKIRDSRKDLLYLLLATLCIIFTILRTFL